jgi:DNA-binding IscR family transcriptional regulator
MTEFAGQNPSTKAEVALDILADLFDRRQRITIAEAAEVGRQRGVSRQTLNRVCHELGVRTILRGRDGGVWVLPR